MDRTAFKQRMQQLKSYREQNPNKGYLDFKRYAEGGETGYELPEVVVTGRKLDKLKPYGNITDMVTQQISTPKPTTQATPVGQSEDVIITANRVNKPVPFGNFGSMVESPQLPSRLNMIPNQPTTPEPIEPIQEEVINSNPQQAAQGSYASDMPIPSMPSMPSTSSMIEPDRLSMEELQQPISPVANTELGQYDAELSKRRHPNRYNTNFSEERDWLINFAKDRAKLPQFKDQLDKDELTKYIFRVNNTPIMPQDPEMYRGPRNSAGVTKYDLDQYVTYDSPEFYNTGANILLSNDPTYGGNTTPFSTNLNSNALHELDHTTQVSTSRATGSKEGFSKRVQKTADVIGYDLNNAKNSNSNYGNTPWEVLSRRQQLLYDLKSDPTKVYKKKDLKNMRSLLKKYDLNYLGDDKILQLLNDVAANQSQPNNMPDNGIIENRVFHGAKGGEIPPTDRPIIPEKPVAYKGKLVKDRYGKKYTEDQVAEYYSNTTDEIDRFTGGPLVRGVKGAIDLEDAANATPVGDAISVYDTYNAAKQGDWAGAGLAALTLLPFVPRTGKKITKVGTKQTEQAVKRYIPKVDPNYKTKVVENALNEAKKYEELPIPIKDKVIEDRNRTYELMQEPHVRKRAKDVDYEFGTDYLQTYDAMLSQYQDIEKYMNLPDPVYAPVPRESTVAFVTPSKSQAINFNRDRIKKPEDIPNNVVLHEMGHLVDAAAGMNNEFLRKLQDRSKFVTYREAKTMYPSMSKDMYDNLLQGTEIKSYINQFRNYLGEKGKLLNGNYNGSYKNLKKDIIDAPKDNFNNLKVLFNLYRSPKLFNKDFKIIPIVNNNKLKEEMV